MPAGLVGDPGSLVCCPRCSASWISRPGDEPRAAVARAPMVRQGPLTIEGDVAPAARAAPRRPLRAGLFATVAILALALAAVVTLSPRVSAGPDSPRAEALR